MQICGSRYLATSSSRPRRATFRDDAVLEAFEERSATVGELILRQGGQVSGFGLIIAGQASVRIDGREHTPGDPADVPASYDVHPGILPEPATSVEGAAAGAALEALHLLQSALVYLNTLLLQRVLADDGIALTEADRRGLSPLFWTHVNPYGHFSLDMDRRLDLAPTA